MLKMEEKNSKDFNCPKSANVIVSLTLKLQERPPKP